MGNPDKYAVISDVHANAEALRAVLRDIEKKRIRDIFFLGDAVGYGPEPNECVEALNSESQLLIAGNHDWAVLGITGTETFNKNARLAVAWTEKILYPRNRQILEAALLKAEVEEKNFTLAHATPYKPEQWHYLLNNSDIQKNFEYIQTDLCYIGHSHKPGIIERDLSGGLHQSREDVLYKEGHKFIVNAGSVGQPRDGDPRACYVLYDGGRIGISRVEYDILVTQKKMRDVGLPSSLIERLSYGL
jgi:predicted phosphodiesterase